MDSECIIRFRKIQISVFNGDVSKLRESSARVFVKKLAVKLVISSSTIAGVLIAPTYFTNDPPSYAIELYSGYSRLSQNASQKNAYAIIIERQIFQLNHQKYIQGSHFTFGFKRAEQKN